MRSWSSLVLQQFACTLIFLLWWISCRPPASALLLALMLLLCSQVRSLSSALVVGVLAEWVNDAVLGRTPWIGRYASKMLFSLSQITSYAGAKVVLGSVEPWAGFSFNGGLQTSFKTPYFLKRGFYINVSLHLYTNKIVSISRKVRL